MWGAPKFFFRKANETLTTEQSVKNLKSRAKEFLESIPIDAIGECTRRARECKLSYLSLLNDESLDNDDAPLRLDEIEKMKKHVKGKSCVLCLTFFSFYARLGRY